VHDGVGAEPAMAPAQLALDHSGEVRGLPAPTPRLADSVDEP
jgi:hypothetical protein